MEELYMIWFIIWIIGCFINCFILNKIYPEEKNNEYINYIKFDFNINLFLDLLKSVFIFSSFLGTIIYIIIKLWNKHNENI